MDAGTLAEQASHDWITKARLTTKIKGLEKPPIEFLDFGEQPLYMFSCEKKRPKIEYSHSKGEYWDWGTGQAIFMFTDKTLYLIKGEPDDGHLPLDYSELVSCDISKGYSKYTVVVKGVLGTKYHIYISDSYDFNAVQELPEVVDSSHPAQSTATGRKTPPDGLNRNSSPENATGLSITSNAAREIASQLQQLDSYSLEQLTADLWSSLGWDAQVTSQSSDRGIDVEARRNYPVEEKQLLQVKRYEWGNKVGSSEVQQYASLQIQEENVDTVVIITTSTFTDPAKQLATDTNVKLINGVKLAEMVQQQQAESLVEKYS